MATHYIQESIPIGCVPSTALAVRGGGCLLQCMLGYVCRGVSAPMHAGIHTPREQNDWQTGVKTLPCRNYVAGGKNVAVITLKNGPCVKRSNWRLNLKECECEYSPSPSPPPGRPWTEWLTDTCESITFPKLLLRAVICYVCNKKCNII